MYQIKRWEFVKELNKPESIFFSLLIYDSLGEYYAGSWLTDSEVLEYINDNTKQNLIIEKYLPIMRSNKLQEIKSNLLDDDDSNSLIGLDELEIQRNIKKIESRKEYRKRVRLVPKNINNIITEVKEEKFFINEIEWQSFIIAIQNYIFNFQQKLINSETVTPQERNVFNNVLNYNLTLSNFSKKINILIESIESMTIAELRALNVSENKYWN